MRAMFLFVACGITLAAMTLAPITTTQANETTKTLSKLTPIEFPRDTFQTRFGHTCTIGDDTVECTQQHHRIRITGDTIEHELLTPETTEPEPPKGPKPAFLPLGTSITRGNLTCGITEKALVCSSADNALVLRSQHKTTSTIDHNTTHELYTVEHPTSEAGGIAATFSGTKGHKFAMADPDGGQIACFIPNESDITQEPNYIQCGTKTDTGLAGQFSIGTELQDLGTARPLLPYSEHPVPGPIDVTRGDVHCHGEHYAMICQTPLGEFQITTGQAGFTDIKPIQLVTP